MILNGVYKYIYIMNNVIKMVYLRMRERDTWKESIL